MRQRVAAAFVLTLLVASAGCTAFGPSGVDEDRLAENVTYDWNTTANATIDIGASRFKAVYQLENVTTFQAFEFQNGDERAPVDPIGLRFRYPNGTTTPVSADAVTKADGVTLIQPPALEGKLAFALSKNGEEVTIPLLVEGSHVVALPSGTAASIPIISHVTPSGHNRSVVNERVVFTWSNPDDDRLYLRYYLNRDVLLLGGLLVVATLALLVGGVHFWLKIRSLEARRESVERDGP